MPAQTSLLNPSYSLTPQGEDGEVGPGVTPEEKTVDWSGRGGTEEKRVILFSKSVPDSPPAFG